MKIKKTTLTFMSALAIIFQCNAQYSKAYVGLSVGPGFAMDNFASKNIYNNSAAFANTGAMINMTFAYKLAESNFGLTALIGVQANPTDQLAMTAEISRQLPDIQWSVESNTWLLGNIMLGGFQSFPVSEKTSLDIRAMAGVTNSNSPELLISGTKAGESTWIKQERSSAYSLSYLLGAGVKFDIRSNFYFLTNLDLFVTYPEFSNINSISSDGQVETKSINQNITTLNLGVGIAFKL